MSSAVRLANSRKTDRINLLLNWLAGGKIVIYDGAIPADANAALSGQTEIVAFDPLPEPAGTVTGATFTLSTQPPAMIASSGSPDFARAFDAEGAVIGDFDVGAAGSGAAIILDQAELLSGALVSIVSFAVSEA